MKVRRYRLILQLANNVEFQLPGQSGFTPGSVMLLGTNVPGQNNRIGLGSATQPAALPGTEEPAELLTVGAGGVLLPPTQFFPVYNGFSDSITVNFIATSAGSENFQVGVATRVPQFMGVGPEPVAAARHLLGRLECHFRQLHRRSATPWAGSRRRSIPTPTTGRVGEYTPDLKRLIDFQLEQAGDSARSLSDTPRVSSAWESPIRP